MVYRLLPTSNFPDTLPNLGQLTPIPARQRRTAGERETGKLLTLQIIPLLMVIIYCRGRSGDEVQDYDYTFTNARRHSNSSTQGIGEFRTKFETTEPEPAFGAVLNKTLDVTSIADGSATSKTRSASSSSNGDCGIRKLSSN